MRFVLLILCVASSVALADAVDTIPTASSRTVAHVWRAGGHYYAVTYAPTGNGLHRRDRAAPWQRIIPDRLEMLYPHRVFGSGDTITIAFQSTIERSTDAGRTWQVSPLPFSSCAIVANGRVAIANADVNRLVIVDLLSSEVAYLDLPDGQFMLENLSQVVDGARTAWINVRSGKNYESVLRVDSIHLSVDRISVTWLHDVDKCTPVRTGGAGIWRGGTMRVDDDPQRSITLTYDPLDLGYPLDVLQGAGAWWFTVPSGLMRSTDGVLWQRESVPSLYGTRCWDILSDTMIVTDGYQGPYLWKIGASTVQAFNNGLRGPSNAYPLVPAADRVVYTGDQDSLLRDQLISWGDEEPRPQPMRRAIRDQRVLEARGELWFVDAVEELTIVVDPVTLATLRSYDRTDMLGVAGMGSRTVVWRPGGLYLEQQGLGELREFVVPIDDEDRPVGIIGLSDRVLAIYLRVFTDDLQRLTVRAFDTTGTEIIGDRLIADLDATMSTQYMRMMRMGTSAVVWMQDAMYVSDDGGISWLRRPMPFSRATWPTVVGDAGMVWSTDRPGVWQTTDVGRTWTRTSLPIDVPTVYSVVATSNHLHLLTENDLLRIQRGVTGVQEVALPQPTDRVRVVGSVLHVLVEAPFTVSVYDVHGRVVAGGTDANIDLRNLANGAYHCVVATDHGMDVTSVLIHGR